ncbi:MAG: hypothetical protein EBY17_30070 [Acidobacteriia bacterium]|nr:hypothetical protein [Terriglobia bacterium]
MTINSPMVVASASAFLRLDCCAVAAPEATRTVRAAPAAQAVFLNMTSPQFRREGPSDDPLLPSGKTGLRGLRGQPF